LRKNVDEKMAGGFPEVPWKIDRATGLPWFTAIHGEIAARAVSEDLHVVHLRLDGLGGVMDTQGPAAVASILRQVARQVSALLDHRDHLSRQSGDRMLVVSARSAADVARLAQSIAEEIARVGSVIDGEHFPRLAAGIAPVARAGDYTQAVSQLDAAILAAEFNAGPHGRSGLPVRSSPPATAARADASAAAAVVSPGRGRRAVLAGLRLDLSGLVATAEVDLALGARRTTARSVGRNAEGRRLFLIGEATTRAVTELLPSGYGAVIHEVHLLQPGTPEEGRGVLSTVVFLSPEREQFLFGVAPAGEDPQMAAARAALSALNRKIEPLLVGGAG
jgi:GGDEF domain-containing protein